MLEVLQVMKGSIESSKIDFYPIFLQEKEACRDLYMNKIFLKIMNKQIINQYINIP